MTDINAEDGILKIRKIVGAWLSRAGQLKARDAMGRISAIILDIASPIEISPGAQALAESAMAVEEFTDRAIENSRNNPPTKFSGILPITNAASLQPGSALGDIAAERERQMSGEGCTPQRDDQYIFAELANAAACYAAAEQALPGRLPACPPAWPWPLEAWKPRSRRENLVRSGALILAEIERIDRAAHKAAAIQEDIPDADDGWIKWDHSEWPGPAGIYSTQMVWVRVEGDQAPRPGFAKDWDWSAEPKMGRSRIVAYRLTDPGQP
jgi:hypothetical protein